MVKRGNCYVCSEAIYHLLGGKDAGWTPMQMKVYGKSHWFLKHESGLIVDATKTQFGYTLNYAKAKGKGFLTKGPSRRAQKLMQEMVWQ